jgi:hypothetical protein
MPVEQSNQEKIDAQFFALRGFEEEKKEIKRLMALNDIVAAKQRFLTIVTIEHLLACPLGTSYFHTYLSQEYNVENLQAYFEAKQLSDYILSSHKKARFDLNLVRQYDENVEKKMAENVDKMDEPSKEVPKCSESTESEIIRTLISSEQKKQLFTQFSSEGKEIAKVVQRIQKFINKYIGENATNEVNIPSSVEQSFLETFENFKQHVKSGCRKLIELGDQVSLVEKKQLIVDGMGERVQMIESVLEQFRAEILINLGDPFSRFLSSENFHELFILFFTADDPDFHRRRILEAGAGGIVLNQQFKWKEDMQARHPLTVVTDLLNKLISVVRRPNLWNWVASSTDQKHVELGINYDQLVDIKDWIMLKDDTAELQLVDMSLLANDYQRISFWINLHNLIITQAALIARGIPILLYSREIFLRKTKYNVGGQEYSIDDIKNAMLRGKKLQKAHSVFEKIKSNDPRWINAVQDNEKHNLVPLINFALADLTSQSANVRVMAPENLVQNLEELSLEWIRKHVIVNFGSETKLILPFLLHEIRSDFKTVPGKNADGMVNFVANKLELSTDNIIGQYKDTNLLITNFVPVLGEINYMDFQKQKENEKQEFLKSPRTLQRTSSINKSEYKFSWNQTKRNAKIKISGTLSSILHPNKKAKCILC